MFRFIITLTSCFKMRKVFTFFFFFGKMGEKGQVIFFFLNNMVITMGCSFVSSLNELCSLIIVAHLRLLHWFFFSSSSSQFQITKKKTTSSLLFISTFRFWPQPNPTRNTSTPKFLHCKAHKNSQAP